MPRKGWVLRRKIPGDPVYGSDLVQKFISSMMYDGKRSTAQTIFYNAMDQVAKKTNDDAFKLFKKAIENCKPVLEVKSRRVGGANYQVPVEVNPFRRQSLAIHWLVLVLAHARRQVNDGSAGGRNYGCCERTRRRGEEEGRRAPHGGSKQGVRALSLVMALVGRR